MKDESPEPSKEIGISIGKTDEEGKVIWKNVRKEIISYFYQIVRRK